MVHLFAMLRCAALATVAASASPPGPGVAEDVEVSWAPSAAEARRLSGFAPGADALPETMEVSLTAGGRRFDLVLTRNRALIPQGARHTVRYADGRVEEGPLPPSCYYIGDVLGDESGSVGLSTCDGGLSGVVIGHEQAFTIEPADAGDVSAFTSKGTRSHKVRSIDDPKFHHHHGAVARFARGLGLKVKEGQRRLSGASTKYVEVMVFNDNARFLAFGGQSGLTQLAKHSTDVMNAATAMYRKAPGGGASFPYTIQVVLVGQFTMVEADPWENTVKKIGDETDCESLLNIFNEWGITQMNAGAAGHKASDNRVLLSGRDFDGNTVGLAGMSTMCWPDQTGNVNMCDATAEGMPHCAATVAHEMGHNFGMNHDSSGNACAESGEIMEAVGGSVAPEQFSSCSANYLTKFFNDGNPTAYVENGECLENTPTFVAGDASCGNGFVEEGEQCDCGSSDCSSLDPCCNGATCKFKDASYECSDASGPCCSSCKFVTAAEKKVCRAAKGTCDLPETCPGNTSQCDTDHFSYPGKDCEIHGYPGLCSNGRCHSLNVTCSIDLNRTYGGGWGLTEQCAKLNDGCGKVICHDLTMSPASPYNCGQGFAVHGKFMNVPDGTPCWFPGSQLGTRKGMCLLGKCQLPAALAVAPKCGNGGIDFGEQCDCGAATSDPCCDCTTCQLKVGKQCSSQEPCCDAATCQFKAQGTVCRAAAGQCDVAEVCSGASGVCPSDVGVGVGTACTAPDGTPSTCYAKVCVDSFNKQCKAVTDGLYPKGHRNPDGKTPAGNHLCTSLSCCETCAQESGLWEINGKDYTDPYVCQACGTQTAYFDFKIGTETNRIYIGAAEDGTVLSDSGKICVGAKPVTPSTTCGSGFFLEPSTGKCLACDKSCAECTGPSNFDCYGNCKFGQDKRGACAISEEQVSFAGLGALVSTTSFQPTQRTTSSTSSAASGGGGTTAPAASAEKVTFTMTVASVSYADLSADAVLLDRFKAAVEKSIASSVGVSASDVEVTLSAGSVKIDATVTPPASGGVTASEISATIAGGESLQAAVASELQKVPDIDTVTTGTIAVSVSGTPQVVTQAPTTGRPEPDNLSGAPPATRRATMAALLGVSVALANSS